MKCKLEYCDRDCYGNQLICVGHYHQLRRNPDKELLPLRQKHLPPEFRNNEGHKKCTKCGIFSPEQNFHKGTRNKDKLNSHCKDCVASHHRTKHGISPEKYMSMLKEQKHRCPICSVSLIDNKKTIDHDHSHCPGEFGCEICVRSILCDKCNVGLGSFNDNIDSLRLAIEYLERFKT